GLYMTGLPIGMLKLKLYGFHKEFGLLVLMLAMVRIVWKIGNISPLLPASIPPWQQRAAHAVHWAFYGFMFAIPLSGWAMTSAAGLPPSFFGLFLLPSLLPPHQEQFLFFQMVHKFLAYGLIATFFAHVGAAFKHLMINKDGIFGRIFR
ncbi:MAG: cytochrome b, partial [Gammaproteobacteria bacterium]